MRPDLDMDALFPGLRSSGTLTERELSAFAEFWDDEASDDENLGTIRWWLDRAGRDNPSSN